MPELIGPDERPAGAPTQARSLLTFSEACIDLGITLPTLRRAISMGQLICIQAPGTSGCRGKRILRQSIDDYLADQIPSNASLKSSA